MSGLGKSKKVDFKELGLVLDKIKDQKRKIELSECPSYCERIADQRNCTPENCIEINKILDRDSDILDAFDIASGQKPEPKKKDKGLKGNPSQRSRSFLRDELKAGKIRDAVRCFRLAKYEGKIGKSPEIIPSCRTTIYGRRGKTDTVILMVETIHQLEPHIKRHGKPLNVRMPSGKRRICLRDCKDCNRNRAGVFKVCHEQELREECDGCSTRFDAIRAVNKWFQNKYLPAIGVDFNDLPYSKIRTVARPMTKSKGVRWL